MGKARQAVANGWFGPETSGRVTFVAVTRIEQAAVEALTDALAEHFVAGYGAPDAAAAPGRRRGDRPDAGLCEAHDDNTLLTVARELTPAGVGEAYRVIEPQDAGLEILAVHGRWMNSAARRGRAP